MPQFLSIFMGTFIEFQGENVKTGNFRLPYIGCLGYTRTKRTSCIMRKF
jgi:hypothetical protein